MRLDHNAWLDRVSRLGISKIEDLSIFAADHPQDESTQKLKDAQTLGYTTVEWHAGSGSCEKCKSHDLHTWTIADFLANLSHDAPVFERSHVGCRSCHLIVTGPEMEPIQVGPYPF